MAATTSNAVVRFPTSHDTQPIKKDMVDVKGVHPALRSRIRGSGYEVYMEDSMPDTPENEDKLVQFVAQEIAKDGKIPHFNQTAVVEIINDVRLEEGLPPL